MYREHWTKKCLGDNLSRKYHIMSIIPMHVFQIFKFNFFFSIVRPVFVQIIPFWPCIRLRNRGENSKRLLCQRADAQLRPVPWSSRTSSSSRVQSSVKQWVFGHLGERTCIRVHNKCSASESAAPPVRTMVGWDLY